MLQQLCDYASDNVIIENNGVSRKWVAIPFWSDSIVFNESSITSIKECCNTHRVVTVLTLMLSVNGPYHVKLHCSSEIFQGTSHEVLTLETVTIPKPRVSYMYVFLLSAGEVAGR